MGSGMTKHVEAFERLRQHRLNLQWLAILRFESEGQIHFLTVDPGSERLLGSVPIETLQCLRHRHRCGQLRRCAVLQLYVDLTHSQLPIADCRLPIDNSRTKRQSLRS